MIRSSNGERDQFTQTAIVLVTLCTVEQLFGALCVGQQLLPQWNILV